MIIIILLLLLFFKPTSTKPQAGKLGQTCRIMVATAIYSVTMVLWKETAFPLRRAMERRWKRNVVSRVSSLIVVIRLPISCVSSMAISCHVPAVSIIIIMQRLTASLPKYLPKQILYTILAKKII